MGRPDQNVPAASGFGASEQSMRILDDTIENVSASAPALLPLFRSDQQLRLVNVLFTEATEPIAINELAQRAEVAQSTASREVARLVEHGILRVTSVGRNTLVSANWSLPWAKDLKSILVQTIGIIGQLSVALSDVNGIEAAYVYGSWAARHAGEPGPPPADIDVAIVGTVPLSKARAALRVVESGQHVEINPVVLDHDRWNARKPEPFIKQIKSRPLVVIPAAVR